MSTNNHSTSAFPTPERHLLAITDGVAPAGNPRSVRPGKALAVEVGADIRRHLSGDHDAMTDLVRRLRPWLYRVAMNCGLNRQSAEDAVQEALLAVVRNIHTLRDPEAGLGWVSVIVRNEARRMIGGQRRTVLAGDRIDWESLAAPDDPERTVTDSLVGTVITDAIARLPERCRQVLTLTVLEDQHDYASISAALDMPVGSIGPTRGRALRKMRELLSPDLARDLGTPA